MIYDISTQSIPKAIMRDSTFIENLIFEYYVKIDNQPETKSVLIDRKWPIII